MFLLNNKRKKKIPDVPCRTQMFSKQLVKPYTHNKQFNGSSLPANKSFSNGPKDRRTNGPNGRTHPLIESWLTTKTHYRPIINELRNKRKNISSFKDVITTSKGSIAINRLLQAFSNKSKDRQTDQPSDKVVYRIAYTRLNN